MARDTEGPGRSGKPEKTGNPEKTGKGEKAPRARPWLLPTVATVAVVIVVAAIVYTIATGQRFF